VDFFLGGFMGWCSGTYVFDAICTALFDGEAIDKKALLEHVINTLQAADWDCEMDSVYWDHPLVQEIFKERNPEWFEEW
jgi:hypothetical protein